MKLTVQNGPLAGRQVPVDQPSLVIGRGGESDITLDDHEISRRHVVIRFSEGVVSVTDLGSRNGTFINGARVTGTQVLGHGDTLQVGQTSLVLQPGEAAGGAAIGSAAPSVLRAPPPAVGRGRSSLPLILGGLLLLLLLVVGAAALVLATGGLPGNRAAATSTRTVLAVLAATRTPAGVPASSTTASSTPAPAAATATSAPAPAVATGVALVQPILTSTPPAGSPPGGAQPTAGSGGTPAAGQPGQAPGQLTSMPGQPVGQPLYTVSWSPGRYEGWADGKRMSSDLTIQNNGSSEIKSPYKPYFIISDRKGQMRSADLYDYGGGAGPPDIPPGNKVFWTWFGVMSEQEYVRGSVFRHAGYSWAQEFNPDGSLAGPPYVIDEKTLIPFLPKEVPAEMIPTIVATMAAGTRAP